MSLRAKIDKRIDKVRYAPIEVFVFHAVSETFDEMRNQREDWMSTDMFKRLVSTIGQRYEFISLAEAYWHLRKDVFRRRRYAVLTCDDGFASVLSVLPFVEEQNIPMTLFVNPKYLDGVSHREGYASAPEYITSEQLAAIKSSLVTIGMHGYEHVDATAQSPEEFDGSVRLCEEILKEHPNYIPYFAYTWGRCNASTQKVLSARQLIPVFCDGAVNYRYNGGISRRTLELGE